MESPNANHSADTMSRFLEGLPRLRVLIVDRRPSARDALRKILFKLGIGAIHTAGSSAEVLRQARTFHFDVILADYPLEDGRDGQQLLEELRYQNLIPRSTVYMLITAERAYRNVVSVAELAPDDYLIRPFADADLHGRLLRALYKKRFFAQVFRHLDEGAYVDALAACASLLAGEEQFHFDALRCKGEILNILGRYKEAQALYREVLEQASLPWARMGLATALRGLDALAEAEALGCSVFEDFPEFLAAYDFVAGVREEMGKLGDAQEILQKAADISPKNSLRQRMLGDIAVRNKDFAAAERAYGRVLERHRGSSLQAVEDYANLARVLVDRGRGEAARAIIQDLRRDWRGAEPAELAALVMDSLCAEKEGERARAAEALEKALVLYQTLQDASGLNNAMSCRISIDLANACLAAGNQEMAHEILGKLAAEHHEDRATIARIEDVFAKNGKEDAGQLLLARVGREIVELNNRGVLAARSGNIEASVRMLSDAAERVPNPQFLVNACKAIFVLLDRKGWDEELGRRGRLYLRMAQARDRHNPKIVLAHELCLQVARKYHVDMQALEPAGTSEE